MASLGAMLARQAVESPGTLGTLPAINTRSLQSERMQRLRETLLKQMAGMSDERRARALQALHQQFFQAKARPSPDHASHTESSAGSPVVIQVPASPDARVLRDEPSAETSSLSAETSSQPAKESSAKESSTEASGESAAESIAQPSEDSNPEASAVVALRQPEKQGEGTGKSTESSPVSALVPESIYRQTEEQKEHEGLTAKESSQADSREEAQQPSDKTSNAKDDVSVASAENVAKEGRSVVAKQKTSFSVDDILGKVSSPSADKDSNITKASTATSSKVSSLETEQTETSHTASGEEQEMSSEEPEIIKVDMETARAIIEKEKSPAHPECGDAQEKTVEECEVVKGDLSTAGAVAEAQSSSPDSGSKAKDSEKCLGKKSTDAASSEEDLPTAKASEEQTTDVGKDRPESEPDKRMDVEQQKDQPESSESASSKETEPPSSDAVDVDRCRSVPEEEVGGEMLEKVDQDGENAKESVEPTDLGQPEPGDDGEAMEVDQTEKTASPVASGETSADKVVSSEDKLGSDAVEVAEKVESEGMADKDSAAADASEDACMEDVSSGKKVRRTS